MKNLDWFQARTLARGGTAVRRDAWRKWLTFESYVWLITQPVWLEQPFDRRVVQQWDFGSDEFRAYDWTDEPWDGGPQPPDPPDPPNPPDPPRPPGGGGGNGGGDPPPGDPPGGGDGGGDGGTGGNGGGGNTGGGGGGWPPGGGGGGGPQPPVPPKPPKPPNPPQPDVPTITVEVNADVDPDGPACFIQPPQTCTVYVNVSIAGGPAGVGTLRVSGIGTPGIQLGTAHPGYNGGFVFNNVPFVPGGTITYSADYGAPGNAPLTHYVGTGSYKFPPACIIFGASWYGSMTEDKSCNHEGPSGDTEDGYTYAASYSVNGQYAVNPEDGNGKSAKLTPVDVNEGTPHIHWTNDTRPDGTHTEGDIDLFPPGSVSVDVQGGGVSNLQPDSLNVFGESQHNETEAQTAPSTRRPMKAPACDLCAGIAALAAKHRIGTVGLTGSFARADDAPGADIDVIVTVPVLAAERFGTALADAAERAVHLHGFDSLPWHHPYHLCVRWLNCRRLPIKLAPRGATVTALQLHGGTRTECRIPVERIPHFVPVLGLPATPPHAGSHIIPAPPLGGFLL